MPGLINLLVADALLIDRELQFRHGARAHLRGEPNPSLLRRLRAVLQGIGLIRPGPSALVPVPASERSYARLTA